MVQLNFTSEIEVFCTLFDGAFSIFTICQKAYRSITISGAKSSWSTLYKCSRDNSDQIPLFWNEPIARPPLFPVDDVVENEALAEALLGRARVGQAAPERAVHGVHARLEPEAQPDRQIALLRQHVFQVVDVPGPQFNRINFCPS